MPTMKETEFNATITWLGVVPKLAKGIRAEPRSEAFASYAGLEDDVHAGLTRASCVRVTNLYPKGTEIRNVRQLSITTIWKTRATSLNPSSAWWVSALRAKGRTLVWSSYD